MVGTSRARSARNRKMAASSSSSSLQFLSLSKPREISTVHFQNQRRRPTSSPSVISYPPKQPITVPHAVNQDESSPPIPEKRVIELEFIGPKPVGGEGNYPREKASAISGDKLLRTIMSDNKIQLYAAYGKVMNCGGGGSCGTCIVEIIDGKDLLNERTNAELKYLKKKPESWRLACQTIVGNKENFGKVVVQRLPQWKK